MEEKDITPTWLESVVKECLWLNISSDPIDRVLSLSVEDAVPKGFNYSGRLLRLKACLQHQSGKVEHQSIVLKSIPLNEDQSTFINEFGLFTLETTMYDEVLNKMEHLLLKYDDERELDWPKHYTVSKENLLLLQDLKEMGYSTIKHREATYEEGLLVVQAIGRFHAMSMLLINKGDISTRKFNVNNMSENDTIVQFVYISTLKAIIDAIRTTNQTQWYHAADTIEDSLTKIGLALQMITKSSRDQNDVLNHGDCWLNNIMFKYSNDSKPLAIKLIDFQLCYHNSLAWDLVHFMYCSYLSSNREKFKPGLIREYRSAVINTLVQLKGQDILHKVPSEEVIEESIKKLSLFGLLVALATTPRIISEINVALDLDITLPDHAHRAKTAVYSIPLVFKEITNDLQQLCDLLINLPSLKK